MLNGSGAAGTATIKMLLAAGVRDVIAVDRDGAIIRDQHVRQAALDVARGEHEPREQARAACATCSRAPTRSSASARRTFSNGEDIKQWRAIRSCSRWRIRPRRSCPTPPRRTSPSWATGRSDFPNQVNNLLGVPGHLPRRARRARAQDHRRDEAGGGPRDRRHRRRRAQRRIRRSRASSIRASSTRSPKRCAARPSTKVSRAARSSPPTTRTPRRDGSLRERTHSDHRGRSGDRVLRTHDSRTRRLRGPGDDDRDRRTRGGAGLQAGRDPARRRTAGHQRSGRAARRLRTRATRSS